jgi:hypothetical protein
MSRLISFLFLTCAVATPALADVVDIPADRDATLIEDASGALANGSGPSVFAGRTGQAAGGIRRALIRFDVASAIPEKALIDNVSLTLHLNKGQSVPASVSLHRVLDDWGEGGSSSNGGGGAPAQADDATWLHTFYDYDYWVQAGGHFIPHASATQSVDAVGFYNWQSTVNLVNDVRLWRQAPRHNFGWLLMGDEESPSSVKRFDSKDGMDVTRHPVLRVEYHLPGE